MSMPVNTATGLKLCCKCGRDVTGAQRMKDHQGRYWCIPCGEADRRHQAHANLGICEGCGESFGRAQLLQLGGETLCPRCRKHKYGHAGRAGSSGGIFASIKSLFGK
jgi:formylmethanofuran dehydrogenase subunit E